MVISSRDKVRLVTVVLLMLAFFSAISPLGHTQAPVIGSSGIGAGIQQNSLTFTVNPDKSVGIAWSTTTSLGSLQNASKAFPPGYAIQSSTSFSQQSAAVVETTNVQYQLPPTVNANLSLIVSSISFSGSQTGLTGSGSLTISTTTVFPVQNIAVSYSTSPTRVMANATADVYFNPQFAGGPLNTFSSQAVFQANWTSTFGSASWRDNIVAQIQTATNHTITVTAFNGTATYPSSTSAHVVIGFVAVPNGASDFITAFLNTLKLPAPLLTGLTGIIQSAINLETGETITMTYTGSSGTVTYHATTNFVSNLDSQLNSIKTQFFQLLFNTSPAFASVPSVVFLNATTVTVSKISMTSNLDLHAGTANNALSGLMISPPTVGASSNFTIPGLFQTLGSTPIPPPGVNITLAGGSDSTYQVKIVVPSNTPAPSSTTANSATWTNMQNVATLQNVQFQLQRLPTSIFAFLTSPIGIAIDALVAAAIIATILVLARRRRAAMPTPVTPSGPTTTPGLGPSPPPPAPSQ